MIRKGLILKLFEASYMQRWNDKLQPIELIEIDIQAHKMFIAFLLGKFEERNPEFSWIEIIENSIFNLLEKIGLTDIKRPIFYMIKKDRAKYKKLNAFVIDQLSNFISPLGEDFLRKFKDYFSRQENLVNNRVLNAAHSYASKWEFNLIETINPNDYEIPEIKKRFQSRLESFNDLKGMIEINSHKEYRNFIDICGNLRFQSRWAQLHRIPRTSVLGHSSFVAILVYLFSLEIDACSKRKYNNYFTGLFHDLPEVFTRDIISPIKESVEGLKDLIKSIESRYLRRNVYSLFPKEIKSDLEFFMKKGFSNTILRNGRRVHYGGTTRKYNRNEFSPCDGNLVKACDDLAAFIEAAVAIQNGCTSEELLNAVIKIKKKYMESSPLVCGINFGELYADF